MLNNHDGYFQHYPFAGGLLDQPGTSMEIFKAIQAEYFEYLREMMPNGRL